MSAGRFLRILSGIEAGYIVCCSTRSADPSYNQVGLVGNHAYSLQNAINLSEMIGGNQKLLQLRNPHGRNEWRGDWSARSSKWTPELRAMCGATTEGGGVFFMEYSDFLTQFESVTVCEYREGWQCLRIHRTLPGFGGARPLHAVLLSGRGDATVSLQQAEMRGRWEPDRLADIGVLVCVRHSERQPWGYCGSGPMRLAAQVHLDVMLEPSAQYLVVPITFNQKETPTDITVVLVSAHSATAQAVSLSAAEFDCCLRSYVTAGPQTKTTHHDGALVSTRKDGCALLVHAANYNPRGWFTLETHIPSHSNMSFARGEPMTADAIPPGHAQFVMAAVPVQASYSYQFEQSFVMSHNGANGHMPPLDSLGMYRVYPCAQP